MQTDRQDLDKRYIELKCIEPHITFPDCAGSLKLTEYGSKIEYESETACADLIETCTIIEKKISKRPDIGEPGGRPDILPPDIKTFTYDTSDYQFGKTTLLSDGRMLILHFVGGTWKRGYLHLALIDTSGVSPVELNDVIVKSPSGSDILAYRDMDIVALRDDTFVLAFHAFIDSYNSYKSILLVGSVTGNVLSFDYFLAILDESDEMRSVSLSGDGSNVFGVFYNIRRLGFTPDWSLTRNTVSFKCYSYNGISFTSLASVKVPPDYSTAVRVPIKYEPLVDWDKPYCCPFPIPAGNPITCCTEEITNLFDVQALSSDMDFMREEGDYYIFAGGYVQQTVVTSWMDYFFSQCLPLPSPRYYQIFVRVAFKVNKSGGVTQTAFGGFYPHCNSEQSRLKCIAIAPRKLIVLVQRRIQDVPISYSEKMYVIGFDVNDAGNMRTGGEYIWGLWQGRRITSLKIDRYYTAAHVYRIDDERFAVAVSDDNTKVYPMAWTDNYFGRFGNIYTADLAPGFTSTYLTGERVPNGKLYINHTRAPYFNARLYSLDVSDV